MLDSQKGLHKITGGRNKPACARGERSDCALNSCEMYAKREPPKAQEETKEIYRET